MSEVEFDVFVYVGEKEIEKDKEREDVAQSFRVSFGHRSSELM